MLVFRSTYATHLNRQRMLPGLTSDKSRHESCRVHRNCQLQSCAVKVQSQPMNLKQIKNLPGARKAAMPEFVPPQLATLVDKPPAGDEWFHELKFDGYRLLCHLERGQVRFWTRNQKDWTAKFPGVGKAVKALRLKSAILDGEIVALDPSGRASFQRLQQSINKNAGAGLIFHVFDLIYIEGFNLTKTPLRERKRCWRNCSSRSAIAGLLRYSDHIEGNGAQFFKEACKFGMEGIVSKLANSTYESTRSRNWLKIKCHQAAGVCDRGIHAVGQRNSVQLADSRCL